MSASNQFTLGKDASLVISGPAGPLTFSIITGFKMTPKYKNIESKALDGQTRHDDIPDGWEGDIRLDRADSTIDDFFAQKEDNYYTGLGSTQVSILETITEVNGSVTQYRYTNVSLTLKDAGDKSADNKVPMVVGAKATRRLKVA
jgi:hypothetical protein